jgi:hypothetical protein
MKVDVDIRQMCGALEVEANYMQPEDPSLRNNPFNEALHPALSTEKAFSLMKRWPHYTHEFRAMSEDVRLDHVMDMTVYMEPLPPVLRLENTVSRIIRQGYKYRNPIDSEWIRQRSKLFDELDTVRGGDSGYQPKISSNITGFSLVGGSGCGKTKWMEIILGLYDQVISHVAYKNHIFQCKQIVWMKHECTVTSPKSFFMDLLQMFDDLLGTYYCSGLGSKNISIDVIVRRIARLSILHGVGILVIDEVQRLLEMKKDHANTVRRFFLKLANIMKVPIVLVGTYSVIPWLQNDFPLTRRIAGPAGMEIWDNFKFDGHWDYFLERLWRYQYTNKPTVLTEEISKTIYAETQGIPDLVVKLYALSQMEVIGQEKELISPEIIRRVLRTRLSIVRPLIKLLKTKSYYDVEEELGSKGLADLLPSKAIFEALRKHDQKTITLEDLSKVANSEEALKGGSSETELLALEQKPQGKDNKTNEENGSDNSGRLSNDAQPNAQKDSSRKSKSGKLQSLVDIVNKAPKNQTPYQSLKNAGVIKDLSEILEA